MATLGSHGCEYKRVLWDVVPCTQEFNGVLVDLMIEADSSFGKSLNFHRSTPPHNSEGSHLQMSKPYSSVNRYLFQSVTSAI
jgi:hypothetical protein